MGKIMRRRLIRAILLALVVIVLVAIAGSLRVRRQLYASLPTLVGRVELAGLSAPVSVARDALGIPTIRGATREDVESRMREAIAFHLDGLREDGAPVPEPRAVASYVDVAA